MATRRAAAIWLGWIFLILGNVMIFAGVAAICVGKWYFAPVFWLLAYFPGTCFMRIVNWLDENPKREARDAH